MASLLDASRGTGSQSDPEFILRPGSGPARTSALRERRDASRGAHSTCGLCRCAPHRDLCRVQSKHLPGSSTRRCPEQSQKIVAFAETSAKRVEASSASWMLHAGEGAAERPTGRLWRVRLAFGVAAHPMTDRRYVCSDLDMA